MGPRFSRLVHAAIAAGSLISISCGSPPPCQPSGDPDVPDPPEDPGDGESQKPVLLDAELLSATVLELRFSKSMAPVNDVEPLDFRVSVGTSQVSSYYYGCSVLTTYQDLGSYGARATVTSLWNVTEEPEVLRLSLSLPVTPAHCNTIDNAKANGNEGGIFVHYARGDGASVQDQDGNRLEDIAQPWVLASADYGYCDIGGGYYSTTCRMMGSFPEMDSWLPIPCIR
jgi:hypothetical protein